MINSMTGYGCAEGNIDDVFYIVEIRSVNSRYFRAKVKLPEMMTFLEGDVEKLVREMLTRGMVTCAIRPKAAAAEDLFDIDQSALQRYLDVLGTLKESARLDGPVDVVHLLSLPGVLTPAVADKDRREKLREKILDIVRDAAEQVRQMRAAEGAALAAELQIYCEAIKGALERIGSQSDTVLQQYHTKLKKRVDELLAQGTVKLDEASVAREVAVFAERSDITEELARLRSHLQRFTECCSQAGQAGRRLDFITQEMLREANTIASKACDTQIVDIVVDIKCNIDRIKEQVQNIE